MTASIKTGSSLIVRAADGGPQPSAHVGECGARKHFCGNFAIRHDTNLDIAKHQRSTRHLGQLRGSGSMPTILRTGTASIDLNQIGKINFPNREKCAARHRFSFFRLKRER